MDRLRAAEAIGGRSSRFYLAKAVERAKLQAKSHEEQRQHRRATKKTP
ncbi:MAG: hypothetical protein WCI05_14040 [Myxococcales bacterium]